MKLQDDMEDGVWLGANERTEENNIGTPEGVAICRATRRRPEGQQWNKELLGTVKDQQVSPCQVYSQI